MEVVAVSLRRLEGGYFWPCKSERAYCNSCTFFSRREGEGRERECRVEVLSLAFAPESTSTVGSVTDDLE